MSFKNYFVLPKYSLLLCLFVFPFFAFAPSNNTIDDNKNLQRILDKLWNAKGDFRFVKPSIEISTGNIGKAALYLSEFSRIEVEQKAYNICHSTNNPDAALSILVGHELAHYFQNPISKEANKDCFYTENAFTSDNPSESKEADADYKGIFNAYLANYDIDKPSKEVLDLLYTGYEFKEDSNYLPLDKRKETANTVIAKTDSLIALYESGNHFYAIGNYALAIAAYKKILVDFEAKEIYNNLGVVYALESLKYAEEGEFKFIYPIEIDVRSKLSPEFGYGKKDKATRELLLAKAFDNFNKALELDSSYKSAKLNKACAISMNGHTNSSAPGHSKDLTELRNWYLPYEAILLEGIRAGLDGNTSTARTRFQEVINSPAIGSIKKIAKLNLDILNGETKSIICDPIYDYSTFPEISSPTNTKTFTRLSTYLDNVCTITYSKNRNGDKIIKGLTGNVKTDVTIYLTTDSALVFDESIKVGSNKNMLDNYHCSRSNIAETNDGYFQLIDSDEALFLFEIDDKTNLISSWGMVY